MSDISVLDTPPQIRSDQRRRSARSLMLSAPRILLIVPGLLAGLLIPALGSLPRPLPAGDVGMTSADFAQSVVTVHQGQQLSIFNDSNVVHVIGPGRDGRIWGTESHVPVVGFHLMQTNSVYKTGPWETPGTYYLTCSVHSDRPSRSSSPGDHPPRHRPSRNRRGGDLMKSLIRSIKHGRYVLGSMSAVLFSSTAGGSF